MSDNKTMLFDLDGSLANYDKAMLKDLSKLLSPGDLHWMKSNKRSLKQLFYEDRPSWLESRMHMISKQVGWWSSLEQITRGFQILTVAKQIGFDIQILTKASLKKSLAWKEKVDWCDMHIPGEYNVTITQTKGDVYGKVLFDDWPDYINDWLEHRPRGLVIMPERPIKGQKELLSHPNVILWDGSVISFTKVREALEIAYTRKMGEPVTYK